MTIPAVPSVVIIGGGITGLSAAEHVHRAAREAALDVEVRLVESSARLGGAIRTERIDGLLLEGGPDQWVSQKPAGLALCERLGMSREILSIRAERPTTQILRGGSLLHVPEGLMLAVPSRLLPVLRSPLLSLKGKARLALECFVPARPGSAGDESAGSFIGRRFGREWLERVAEPILAGIFTSDVDAMSLDMCLPRLRELEQGHGSVFAGIRRERAATGRTGAGEARGFVSLSGGLGTLVERLSERLPQQSARTGHTVERLGFDHAGGVFTLALRGRPGLHADAVILACPGHVAASLMREANRELAASMDRLGDASCATVNLLYSAAAIARPAASFGFFVPRGERASILACSDVSAKFPDRAPAGRVLMRVFLGGTRDPHVLQQDDDELALTAHSSLAASLGIREPPLFCRVERFERSMPQYPVGYRSDLERMSRQLEATPGLFLAGGLMGAVGLPDCVTSGERAAAGVLGFLASRAARASLAREGQSRARSQA